MANQLDKFDQLIKDSYEGYEAPYDPAHWEELEEELAVAAPGLSTYFGAITTGLVAVSLVFLSMLFFFSGSGHEGDLKNTTPQPVATVDKGQSSATATNNAESDANAKEVSGTEESEDLENPGQSEIAKIKSNKPTASPEAKSYKGDETTVAVSNNQSITATSEPNAETKVRTGCTGLVINFEASENYGEGAKYLWNFGDGYFSNEPNPSHTFNKEGVFDVSLSVTSKSTGQISSNVVQAMIEVVEAPVANLEVNIENPTEISLHNESYNASTLEWNVDGNEISDKSKINLSVADNTRYRVVLSAMNESGCSDTLESAINSITAGGEFPRAMDQTSGHNFAPGAILDGGKVTSIKIYDKKSGSLVFDGYGNKGWNGTTRNGKPADKGTYRWLMVVKTSDSVDIYKGDIELR